MTFFDLEINHGKLNVFASIKTGHSKVHQIPLICLVGAQGGGGGGCVCIARRDHR